MSEVPSLPPVQGERHTLKAEEELRLEVNFSKQSQCHIVLQHGSCELFGVELAVGKQYTFTGGGLKIALFTWHGCTVDIDSDEAFDIAYVTDETDCNVAYVNTHAQLEALRDEAASSNSDGPRVLIVGPKECGKSSLFKILTAYAVKLGRTPLAIDLDPNNNGLSIPGTLAVSPMSRDSVTVQSNATTGLPPPNTTSSLVLWHASKTIHPALFKAQVSALASKINKRLQNDDLEQSSGLLVNTNGWIDDEGYELLLHTVGEMKISVILIIGHDKLYSMFKTDCGKQSRDIKVIKLPRSGGVVSRNSTFLRHLQSISLKQYFYGDMIAAPPTGQSTTPSPSSRVPQLTPFLLQLPFDQLTIYRYSSIQLSKSLLPVGAAQATEAVQLAPENITDQLQHAVLAVCHPHAVQAYMESGKAGDLYESGVAGFCAVERVLMETERIHLLSPCAGSLPSNTLLVGDITWME